MTTICDQSLALYTEPCSLAAKLWISDPLGFQVLVKFAKEPARQNKWAWITLKHPFSETLEDSGMLSGQSPAKLWMFIAFRTHQVHADLPQEVHCAESHGCMGRGSKKQYYTQGSKKMLDSTWDVHSQFELSSNHALMSVCRAWAQNQVARFGRLKMWKACMELLLELTMHRKSRSNQNLACRSQVRESDRLETGSSHMSCAKSLFTLPRAMDWLSSHLRRPLWYNKRSPR